jgi:hypothetical protein
MSHDIDCDVQVREYNNCGHQNSRQHVSIRGMAHMPRLSFVRLSGDNRIIFSVYRYSTGHLFYPQLGSLHMGSFVHSDESRKDAPARLAVCFQRREEHPASIGLSLYMLCRYMARFARTRTREQVSVS